MLGTVHGHLVATQAVVQNGGGITGQSQHPSLGSPSSVFESGVDELHGLGFDAAPGTDEEPGVEQACVAGRDRNRIRLLDRGLGGHQLPAEQVKA